MKTNVTYENHEKYTEQFPFIFHRDIIKGKAPEDESAIVFKDGERHYYAAGRVNWHKNIEILFFFDGEGELHAGNKIYTTRKNEVYVINSNDLHNVSSEDYTGYYCLIVDRNFCLQNNCPVDTLCFSNERPDDKTLVDMFSDIVSAFSSSGSLRTLRIKSSVLRLLTELSLRHAVESQKKTVSDKNTLPIKAALQYIEENLTAKLTLSDVASAAGMSKYYFAGAFRRAVGCTCIEYINEMRCHMAKSLLAKGECTVGEVCYLCGFENLSYFSRTFFRYTGMLPSECRRREGKKDGQA